MQTGRQDETTLSWTGSDLRRQGVNPNVSCPEAHLGLYLNRAVDFEKAAEMENLSFATEIAGFLSDNTIIQYEPWNKMKIRAMNNDFQ